MGLCTLAELKLQLNKTTSADDTELQSYIDAVSAVIERLYGPIAAASGHTWTANGGSTAILLPERPASITSVVENGFTLASTDYFTDLVAGVLYRGSTVRPFTWLAGVQNVTVTYTVGGTVGADVNLAARTIVQEWWELQRGPKPLPLQGGTDTLPDQGFRIFTLRRASEMLAGLATPGFA